MGKVTRRLLDRIAQRRDEARAVELRDGRIELLLFGTVTRQDHPQRAERDRLRKLFVGHMADFGAVDPVEFWSWLQRERRGYDPRSDGPSAVMAMVDEVKAIVVDGKHQGSGS
jgi:hypothetical protein